MHDFTDFRSYTQEYVTASHAEIVFHHTSRDYNLARSSNFTHSDFWSFNIHYRTSSNDIIHYRGRDNLEGNIQSWWCHSDPNVPSCLPYSPCNSLYEPREDLALRKYLKLARILPRCPLFNSLVEAEAIYNVPVPPICGCCTGVQFSDNNRWAQCAAIVWGSLQFLLANRYHPYVSWVWGYLPFLKLRAAILNLQLLFWRVY
jgi:hypothetical protein